MAESNYIIIGILLFVIITSTIREYVRYYFRIQSIKNISKDETEENNRINRYIERRSFFGFVTILTIFFIIYYYKK
jgi:uncharacterized membrane protein